jgi:predicted nucleic acid-binding Zn ribbon protein
MPVLRYRCPTTGELAEVWTEFEDDPEAEADNFFDAVFCQACGGAHLINPRTGKVLGQPENE